MKASEFLCPELVWINTDDNNDDLTARRGRSTSPACALQQPRLHFPMPCHVEAITALHNQVILAAEQGISSAAHSARAQNKWNGANGTHTDGYVFEKVHGQGFPWLHLFSTMENTGYRSMFARNLIGHFKLGKV